MLFEPKPVRSFKTMLSMRSQPLTYLPAIMLLGAFPALASEYEDTFLSHPVRITAGLTKAGEGYFAQDMSNICYQGIPADKPFYQIFIQPFASSNPRITQPFRVSTGKGRTTCAWFSPNGKQLLFASSHLDPDVQKTEEDAIAQAKADAISQVDVGDTSGTSTHTWIYLSPIWTNQLRSSNSPTHRAMMPNVHFPQMALAFFS